MPHEIMILRPPYVAACFAKEKKAYVFNVDRNLVGRLPSTPNHTMLPTSIGQRKVSRGGTREGFVGTVSLERGKWVGDFYGAKGIVDVPDAVITDVAEAFGFKRDAAPEPPKPQTVRETPVPEHEKPGLLERVGSAIKGVFGGGHEPEKPAGDPLLPKEGAGPQMMKFWMVQGQMYIVNMDTTDAQLDQAASAFNELSGVDRDAFFRERVGATPVAFHESKGG